MVEWFDLMIWFVWHVDALMDSTVNSWSALPCLCFYPEISGLAQGYAVLLHWISRLLNVCSILDSDFISVHWSRDCSMLICRASGFQAHPDFLQFFFRISAPWQLEGKATGQQVMVDFLNMELRILFVTTFWKWKEVDLITYIICHNLLKIWVDLPNKTLEFVKRCIHGFSWQSV